MEKNATDIFPARFESMSGLTLAICAANIWFFSIPRGTRRTSEDKAMKYTSNHTIDSDAGMRCALPGARHRVRWVS